MNVWLEVPETQDWDAIILGNIIGSDFFFLIIEMIIKTVNL